MARIRNGLLNNAFTGRTLGRVSGQEDVANPVLAGFGQFACKQILGEAIQKAVRQASHDAGAVAGVGFVANSAAMLHAAVHVIGILQDLVAGSALNVTDEADATAIFFIGWVVKPIFAGQIALKCQRHKSSQCLRDPSAVVRLAAYWSAPCLIAPY